MDDKDEIRRWAIVSVLREYVSLSSDLIKEDVTGLGSIYEPGREGRKRGLRGFFVQAGGTRFLVSVEVSHDHQ